jgi:3-oxoadipate enol-lactonase
MEKLTLNGIKLTYERHGKGTPLVLLHGYPLDHTIWEPLVPFLESDFDLILPDLRGFGESDIVSEPFTMADFAADISGLLDQLVIPKAAIAGHSMGGYIALAFARAFPERLLGLGLVSSQALADSPEKKAGRHQEAEHILTHGVGEVAEGMSVKLTARPALQIWLKELILRQRPEGLAGGLLAMAKRLDSTLLLQGFNYPVSIIHGDADGLIPVERARSLKVAIPWAHLTEIPAVGHMPMMEAPQKTAEGLKSLSET